MPAYCASAAAIGSVIAHLMGENFTFSTSHHTWHRAAQSLPKKASEATSGWLASKRFQGKVLRLATPVHK